MDPAPGKPSLIHHACAVYVPRLIHQTRGRRLYFVALLRTLRGGGVLENLWEATENDDEVGSLVVHVDRHSSLAGEAELKAQPHGMWRLSIVFLEASRAPLTRTTPEGPFMHPLDHLHPIGGFLSTPHP